MSSELSKIIHESFPKLFSFEHYGKEYFVGIETEDGWYDLIKELSGKISAIDPEAKVHQIKEKFSTMRYYCSYTNDRVSDLIREYEQASAKICEICGKGGKVRNDLGWIKTLCEKHYKEIKSSRK